MAKAKKNGEEMTRCTEPERMGRKTFVGRSQREQRRNRPLNETKENREKKCSMDGAKENREEKRSLDKTKKKREEITRWAKPKRIIENSLNGQRQRDQRRKTVDGHSQGQ